MEARRAAKLALGRKKLENHQRKKKTEEIIRDQENSPETAVVNILNVDQNFTFSSKESNGELRTNYDAPNERQKEAYISDSEPSTIPIVKIFQEGSCDDEIDALNKNNCDHIDQYYDDISTYQKSIEILIKEKSALTSKLKSLECDISQTKEQNEQLNINLNLSNNRITALEEELSSATANYSRFQLKIDSLVAEKSVLLTNEIKMRQKYRDFDEKLEDSTTMLQSLVKDNENLKAELQRVKSEYEISQLHIQQVSQVNDNVDLGEKLQLTLNEKNMYLKLLQDTQEKLKESELDKNQINQQYQQYVQQLNDQLGSLAEKHENLLLDFEKLREQEQSLLRQMGILEKQLQSANLPTVRNEASKDISNENETLKNANKQLLEKIDTLDAEYRTLKNLLSEKDSKLEELNDNLLSLQTEKVDMHKLIAANESDRVAAQLATTQNIKLKNELLMLQDAYKLMSDGKLELTQLLETERDLNKDLIRKLGEDQYNVKDLQIKLKAKDDEMIRLQSNCSNLETECLQLTQANDNLRHYEAVSQNIHLLQNELDSTHQKLILMTEENNKLKHKETVEESELVPSNKYVLDDSDNGQTKSSNNNVIDPFFLPTEEAMMKLQDRFAVTVKELAELSDEKQKLEHIVLQLQSETETICEYIALYHTQRAILKQRENEKNAQLAIIVQEKSRLKDKLDQLKFLINSFLSSSTSTSQNMSLDNNVLQKILSLLSDLTNCQLIEDNVMCQEKFGPCPCCSGKIINV